MRNIHLDFMQRARFCDPTGGYATLGVIMAVGGATGAYGAYSEGSSTSAMYRAAARNAELQKDIYRRTAEQNTARTKAAMERNISATMMDASMQAKSVQQIAEATAGTQKATSAAMGVGGGSVSQADALLDTFDKQKMDEMAIRYNADAAAAGITDEGNQRLWDIQYDLQNKLWAADVEKQQYEYAAKNAKKAGNIKALGSILDTASSIGQLGLQYKRYGSLKMPTAKTSESFTKTQIAKAAGTRRIYQ
jgi:hypothetical protein